MSSASLAQKQILRAKIEAETSLASARSLRDQWLVAANQNPTGLTQKEIEHLSKAFKNRLLTVKWDCEDLEELVSGESNDNNSSASVQLAETKHFIRECREEIAKFMNQLEDHESGQKIFNKHGIISAPSTLPNNIVAQAVAPVASIIQNPLHSAHYEHLSNEHLEDAGGELPHFDKSQIETSTTIFNNSLYEHYEDEDSMIKNLNATKVFNNLTRPISDEVCVGSNENEMILEMLETEYYNPPPGLLAKTKYTTALRNFFEAYQNKFLGTIFAMLLLVFFVI